MKVQFVTDYDDCKAGEVVNLAPVVAEELIRAGKCELTADALTPYAQRVRRD
ncbi:MAG: hypothetical protein MUF27_03645 [Acidobacteria bacterium]|jgi:hypothetical protein|nr:hypothetical protein [Acidobacteriota bacterium]